MLHDVSPVTVGPRRGMWLYKYMRPKLSFFFEPYLFTRVSVNRHLRNTMNNSTFVCRPASIKRLSGAISFGSCLWSIQTIRPCRRDCLTLDIPIPHYDRYYYHDTTLTEYLLCGCNGVIGCGVIWSLAICCWLLLRKSVSVAIMLYCDVQGADTGTAPRSFRRLPQDPPYDEVYGSPPPLVSLRVDSLRQSGSAAAAQWPPPPPAPIPLPVSSFVWHEAPRESLLFIRDSLTTLMCLPLNTYIYKV